jgi:hypothetical protein
MRLLMLGLSLVLGVVPVLGVVWIVASGMIKLWPPSATVDGLFMSLILLSLAACFLLNAFWELRDQGFLPTKKEAAAPAKAPAAKAV